MSLSAVRAAVRRAGPSTPTASLCRGLSTSSVSLAPSKKGSKKKKKTGVIVNPNALPLSEAVRVLRAIEIANPGSAFSLEMQTRYNKGAVPLRGRIALPSDPRRVTDTIVVFAEPDSASSRAAVEAGAHHVGAQDLFPKILSGEIVPTKCLATPTMVPHVAKSLARFLGPKGLMPVAKRGTVGEGDELANLIRAAGGTVEWKADKLGWIRAPVARMTFGAPAIQDNVSVFVGAVRTAAAEAASAEITSTRPKTTTRPVLKVRLLTTNGPCIELNDVL